MNEMSQNFLGNPQNYACKIYLIFEIDDVVTCIIYVDTLTILSVEVYLQINFSVLFSCVKYSGGNIINCNFFCTSLNFFWD